MYTYLCRKGKENHCGTKNDRTFWCLRCQRFLFIAGLCVKGFRIYKRRDVSAVRGFFFLSLHIVRASKSMDSFGIIEIVFRLLNVASFNVLYYNKLFGFYVRIVQMNWVCRKRKSRQKLVTTETLRLEVIAFRTTDLRKSIVELVFQQSEIETVDIMERVASLVMLGRTYY